ncbi:type II toxin-antitoxin system antitoxin DNA ADP-ribosyl glycohydrolase DarG [Salinibacter altiplanensis]|uniref:type II toxin-antitoxin system antitoxin DNA ADP-ribosyl glycohydrolase DarG n=1 Tax=Salinibacter altiplanensis TaxID=1803181 RepID=UPI000C9ECE74|nr:macro domain-containing protein [Salinibacter altiplanensis]
MVEIVRGDLFDADVAALVNPVHCAGLMKRGLCRQFKTRFPDNFEQYKAACNDGGLAPGDVLVHDRGGLFGDDQHPRYVLNVATKDHWRDASSPTHIESGMAALIDEAVAHDIPSLAVPALGCGGGGLDWPTVRPLLTAPLQSLNGVRARLYAPRSADAQEDSGADERPAMTRGRALLLAVFDAYAGPGDTVSPHAAHNLAFLLQGLGEALRLTFEPGPRGLRATGLTAVLRRINGHFVAGHVPSHQESPFRLRQAAIESAGDVLSGLSDATERLGRARELIEGYDAPDALELLATVGWIMRHDAQARRRPEAVVRAVQDWSRRKAERFASEQITAAWQRLRRHEWISPGQPADSE